jgi:hypothetical protein
VNAPATRSSDLLHIGLSTLRRYPPPCSTRSSPRSIARRSLRQDLRVNLFRDLSRIILSLSQLPLPRIGSWTIDERGVLTLANRPLIHQFQSLENEGIPTNIARTLTYTTADAYYIDLLACHDNRIRNQPNSIVDEKDGRAQMANLFAMRGLLPHFTSRDLRYGPFVFNLTDLHGSNIFVDCDWHIKYIIDLEWACSLPIEMLTPPYWITSRAVDELEGDELQTFEKAYQDFTDIFEEEEKSFSPTYGSATYRTDIMRRVGRLEISGTSTHLKAPKGCSTFSGNMCSQYLNRDAIISRHMSTNLHRWYRPIGLLMRERLSLQNLRTKRSMSKSCENCLRRVGQSNNKSSA